MKLKIDHNIELVPISLEYAGDIYESFDEEIIRFLPIDIPPQKIEDTIAFINHSIEQMKNETDLVWVILKDDNFTGCCGIHTLPSRQPHFGLWIRREQQGQGIGKKVVQYVLNWAITNLDVEYIKYPVDKHNIKSLRLIKELNLVLSDVYKMGNIKKLEVEEYRLYKR